MSNYKKIKAAAVGALGAGHHVIPLKEKSKQPAWKNWPERRFKDGKALMGYLRAHPNANFGVVMGNGIFVLDVDGEPGQRELNSLVREHGKLPKTVRVITGQGQHIYLRNGNDEVRNSSGKLGQGLDIRGAGGYVVLAGSTHPNGATYKYKPGRELGSCSIAKAPTWLIHRLAPTARKAPEQIPLLPKSLQARSTAYFARVEELEYARLKKAPQHQRNATLNLCSYKLGQLLHLSPRSKEQIRTRLIEIAREIGLSTSESTATVASGMGAGQSAPRPFPPRKSAGCIDGSSSNNLSSASAKDELTRKLARYGETDTDNAKRFVRRQGRTVLHSPGLGWYVFDGKIWRADQQKKRVKLAIKVALQIAKEVPHLKDTERARSRKKFSLLSKSKGALDRMLQLAEPELYVRSDDLDNAPDLLSVRNGTIDLKTGELLPHDPTDLVSRIVDIPYDADARAPEFIKFISQSLNTRADLIEFVQLAVGYSLTGHVREKVFFYQFGEHDTGKTILQFIIGRLLGEYAKAIPTDMFVAKAHDSIPNDQARLKGVRFAAASEANFNKKLDEAKIKLLTGGDRIPARFLFSEWFEYMPSFKIWIAANDQPRVRATDGALWERIRVIPFTRGYQAQDKQIREKLLAELPGILAWAVEGARRWYREGLPECSAVRVATNHWRNSVDVTKQFFQECCLVTQGETVPAMDMYARFKKWCTENGEKVLGIKEFKGRLIELNLVPGRNNHSRFWRDVKLVK